ncbi:cysteine dioxygenase [Luteimonas sp. SDU82]|uniref:cysteine dioxygenase n=1 Tax=Luteimonas sp. SDU82 TaxID=3422592 RepID=UPI003EC13810
MASDAPTGIPFLGQDRFIAAVDAAVRSGDGHAVTARLRSVLCELIRDPAVRLPDCVHERLDDHYARREIYRSPDLGYSVIAMTWGPGQGTPVHDHCGLWCVEGVWHGELEITQYELLETEGERSRFRAAGGMRAGPGSAGSLIPPHEYHTIHNGSDDAIAVSVHIYEGRMDQCCRFEPEDGEWYRRVPATLTIDRAA